MSEDEKHELIEYIIKFQDHLTYCHAKQNEENMPQNPNLKGLSIKEWIIKIPELVNAIDSSNLVVLSQTEGNDKDEIILTELLNRFDKGEPIFTGGKVESLYSFRYEINSHTFLDLYKKRPEIRDRILEDEVNEMKTNPRLDELITKVNSLVSIEGFYAKFKSGKIDERVLDFLEELASQNPNILDTINPDILEPEILSMNPAFLQRIARYKDKSTELSILYKTNPILFKAFKKSVDEWENNLSPREAINLEDALISQSAIYMYSLQDVKEEDFDDVLNFCIRKQERRPGEFECNQLYPYTKGYEEFLAKECDDYFDKKQYFYYHKKYLNAYTMKYLGVSYERAKTMFERKFKNVEIHSIGDKQLKEYISRLHEIIMLDDDNPDNAAALAQLYHSNSQRYTPRFVVKAEEQTNQIITSTYENSFQDTKDYIEASLDFTETEFNGQNVHIVNMPAQFSVAIRSTDTGFKQEIKLENDSIKTYEENNPDPSVGLVSSAYMTNDFTGVAPLGENGTYFVYFNNNRQNIGEIGNGDISSNIIDYGITSKDSKSMTADRLTQNSRQVYAEMTLLPRPPDAIGLFSDASERQKELALQAASEYGIDICFFDKDKLVDNQIANLQHMMQRFSESNNLQDLANLISMYETNIAGWLLNRDDTVQDTSCFVDIDNKRFAPQFEVIENDIYRLISGYCRSQPKDSTGKQNILNVASILQSEIHKYDDLITLAQFPKMKMKFRAEELLQALNKNYDLGLDLKARTDSVDVKSPQDEKIDLDSLIAGSFKSDLLTSADMNRGKELIEDMIIGKEVAES